MTMTVKMINPLTIDPARHMPWAVLREGEGEGGSGGGENTGGDAGTAGKAGDTSGGSAPGGGDSPAKAGDTVLSGGTAEGEGNSGSDATDGEAGEAKTGDGEGAKGAEGEGDYALEMPEGFEVDQGLLDAVKPAFKEVGLTNEQAQTLASAYAEHAKQAAEQRQQEFAQQVQTWRDTAENDQEIGGKNWDAAVETANQALDKVGTPELKQALAETGMGNHPELIRAFYRMGRATADDSFITGNATESATPLEQRFYGDTTPKEKRG